MDRRVEAEVSTVNQFIQSQKLDQVGFITIDTEGSDFTVILGVEQSLRGRKIDVIQVEYGVHWVDLDHSMKAVMDCADVHGYRFGRLTLKGIGIYTHWHPDLGRFIVANFVFVSLNASPDISTIVTQFNRCNVACCAA